MRHRIILVIILMVIIVFGSGACLNSFLPIYETTNDDGMSIKIDGVTYKELPKLKWYVNPTGSKLIGYAGSQDVRVSTALADTEKNFVFIQYAMTDYYSKMLYRSDKNIPDVSRDSVDKIIFSEEKINSDIPESNHNTVEDRKTILLLFDLFENEKKIEVDLPKKRVYDMNIWLYCSDLSGASCEIQIITIDGKLLCGNSDMEYVELPMDLFEKLAGHSIDINMYDE